MNSWIPLTAGLLLLVYSLYYYARDCKGNVSASMGGEMSFSVYWGVGILLFSVGILPLFAFSRWWSIGGFVVGMILSVPIRAALAKRVCISIEEEPTGFQKFARKTEQEKQD